MDLLNLLKGHFGPVVAEKVGALLGLDKALVAKVLDQGLPAMLGGLGHKLQSATGATDIESAVRHLNLPDSIDGMAGAADTSGYREMGSGLLGTLFGSNLNGVVERFGKEFGLGASGITGILGAAAPLLMGLIKKEAAGGNIAGFLDGHKAELAGLMPFGLGDLYKGNELPAIGIASKLEDAPDVEGLGAAAAAAAVASGVQPTGEGAVARVMAVNPKVDAPRGPGAILWAIPALLAGLGIVYALGIIPGFAMPKAPEVAHSADAKAEGAHGGEAKSGDTHGGEAKSDEVPVTAEVPQNTLERTPEGTEMVKATMPDGSTLSFPVSSVEDQLLAFIQSDRVVDQTTWFNFDRLLFDTGKATLRPESNEQLDNVAKILTAYPNVNLKIGGYTDNTGDRAFNQQLSADRAKATMSGLIDRGIEATRLASEGYGDQFPIGDNNTEEGRQQNRRIALRVTQK